MDRDYGPKMHLSVTIWHLLILIVLAFVLFGPGARYWPRDH